MALTETRPDEVNTDDPDLLHVVCCTDPRTRAFCGKPYTGRGTILEAGVRTGTMCVVCAEMEETDRRACPEGGRCRFA